jgi:DNA-binding response OmpR family regulator
MLKHGDFTGNSQVAQSLISQTIPVRPFVNPVFVLGELHPVSCVNRARFRPGSPLVVFESALTNVLNHSNFAPPATEILGELSCNSAKRRCNTSSVNQSAILQKEEKLMATATLAASLNTPISELRPAAMERILVVEDDGALRKILQRLFSSEGYEVDVVPDGVAGLEMLRQRLPSAIIVDLQAPGSSECDFCKEIANLLPGVPLVILSASSKVADKVLLLEMGADDYVTIPFSPRELVARLRALLRRASRFGPEDADEYVFADVIVDFSKTEITRGGEKITVTPKEFKTLEFLAKNAHRVISRDELLNEVWGYQNYPCTRTVDNHILRLRQKLETDPARPSHFLTVHRLGYKFVP